MSGYIKSCNGKVLKSPMCVKLLFGTPLHFQNKAGEKMEYQYPIQIDWSTKEIVDVIKFYESVEKAYEKGIERDQLLTIYRRFKEIVPSKAEEKKLCNEFEDISGYSAYRLMKKAKESNSGEMIKMF